MAEKIYIQKHVRHMFAAFALLFLIPFLSMAAGIRAQAEGQGTPVDNPAYTFTSTDGSKVSTAANPGETTVLVFGNISCSRTRGTLTSLAASDWAGRPDIRVIFAESGLASLEETKEYEKSYQCPSITFCYDETQGILAAMAGYAGKSGGLSPIVVLIDKDNKVQSVTEGKKTADEIIAEIKKFADIDYAGEITPPAGSGSGLENFPFILKSIDGTDISTIVKSDATTVLIFGYTNCGNTKATLQSIAGSSWGGAHRSDIRMVYADVRGADLAGTTAFAKDYQNTDVIFCHDEEGKNFNHALSYLGLYGQNGGAYPYIVYIDKNNKVQNITLGPKTADEILAEINKAAENAQPGTSGGSGSGSQPGAGGSGSGSQPGAGDSGSGGQPGAGDSGSGGQPGTGDSSSGAGTGTGGSGTDAGTGTEPGQPDPDISNVTGLKATSSAKSIKLTWKKIPQAKGYIIYQYNSSKKSWEKKGAKTENTASYTLKKLTPATSYRFAVKAYTMSEDGRQVTSKSYKSIYTATAPGTVSFKVTPGKRKATVKWSKQKGATGYIVYYKTKASASWKKLKTTKSASYTKTKLKSGKTYIFTVKAYKTYKGKTYTSSFRSKKVKIK